MYFVRALRHAEVTADRHGRELSDVEPLSQSASDLIRSFVDNVDGKHTGRPGALLAILQQVENRHPRKYLPLEMLG